MSKLLMTLFIPPVLCLGITLGTIHYEKKPVLYFPPSGCKVLHDLISDFQWKRFKYFLLSLLLWPDGSITFFSRKSMNRQSKGDSSHRVVPDALVYSTVLRDIYWQKFNGFLEDFPESLFWGWKLVLCAAPIKKTYFAQ